MRRLARVIFRSNFTPLSTSKHTRKKPRRSRLRMVLQLLQILFVIVTSVVLGFGMFFSYMFVSRLPSPELIGKMNFPLTTHIYDRDGTLLYSFYRDQNRTPIKLDQIPPYVYQASIAVEDKDFFRHKGVSLIGGVARAAKENLTTNSIQGGSTITQQLVKSSLLTPERTIERKIKEIVLALWTERMYTKYQILEMYLNQVPYGGSAYGIEEAAKTYFKKHAKDLTLDEAALLAGLPQAPSVYSPYVDTKLTINRRNEVLAQMFAQGYITKKQYDSARTVLPNIEPLETTIKNPHFVFYVKSELEKLYGTKMVEEGGMNVKTSIDSKLQSRVEQILRDEITNIRHLNVSNGAVLVTRPATGEILAMAGSIDYYLKPSGSFNVTTGHRQPGSSIKPLLYAYALERGQTAASTIADVPVSYPQSEGTFYKPVNYDSRFHGTVTIRSALANSYNIPAVKTIDSLGVAAFVQFAQQLGLVTLDDPNRYGLSLSLGGGEVRMVDMATAFGSLANQGNKVDLTPFVQIDGYDGKPIKSLSPEQTRVISNETSYIIADIMSDNVARTPAFGARSDLEIPGYKIAVKTGTTDNKKDNWTIGFTPEFVVTVWVGNNDNTPMNQLISSGLTGASPIWNKVMTHLLKSYSNKNTWYNVPAGVVTKQCGGRNEYFVRGTESIRCFNPIPPTKPPTP